MEKSTRDRIIVALTLLLAVGVFLADVYLTPELVLPGAVWGIPILVAALFLSPRIVAAIVVSTLALEAWAGLLHGAAAGPWYLYVLGVAIMGLLGVMLAARIGREAALAEERARLLAELEATVQAAPAGVITYDPTGKIVRMNAAAERIMGYSPSDLALPMNELVARLRFEDADGQPMPLEEFPPARALRGKRVAGVAIAFHRSDDRGDRKVWVLDGAGPIRAQDGTLLGAVASFVDVTELRELEEQQRQLLVQLEARGQEARRRAAELQGVLDNMVEGVLVCDAEGQITLVNESAVRVLGLADLTATKRGLAELPGLLRLRHPDGRPIAPSEMATRRALAGQTVVLEDQVILNPQTRRDVYVRVSAAPIRGAEGRIVGAVAVVRDVTELTELDRLKDQFISVAAHELKTPVTAMQGYAQVLMRTATNAPPQWRRMLEAIDRGAHRIDAIVLDLLDISRLQAGQLELTLGRVDLPELAGEVVDRLALTTTKHRVRVVRADPVVVQADRDRLEQVLVNLIDNAIRYSPNGGDVDVAVAVRDHEAVVSVKDQGVGIPKEKQARIFGRFYRAHMDTPYDYGGMGVGLYISNEIVKRHGGRMWFESQEGQGSTFGFALPLAHSSPPAA